MFKFEVYCDGEYLASYWADEGFQAVDKAKLEFNYKLKTKCPVFYAVRSSTR